MTRHRRWNCAILAGILLIGTENLASAFLLPDSGQEKCYQAVAPYAEITCKGTGQDGEYKQNPLSYTNEGNSTASDDNTGLEWQRRDSGKTYSWQAAGDYCSSLSLGGHSDWRLPSQKELQTIVKYGTSFYTPSIDTDYFPNTKASMYWSSTTIAAIPGYAVGTDFFAGNFELRPKRDRLFVRCVRGPKIRQNWIDNGNGTVTDGLSGLVWQKRDAGKMSWGRALKYCQALNLAGRTDWRLPSVRELSFLTDYSRPVPPWVNQVMSSNTHKSFYWTSTTLPYWYKYAWPVGFGDEGGDYRKSDSWYVRCVCGGQVGGPFGNLAPAIDMKPKIGPPGTTFAEWGDGFTQFGTATLHFFNPIGEEILPPLSQALDENGHFEITPPYVAPLDKASGSYTWHAVDDITGRQSNTVTYQITPIFSGSANVVVKVIAGSDQGVQGVDLTLLDSSGSEKGRGITDDKGIFTFVAVPGGNNYSVKAANSCVSQSSGEIAVLSSMPIPVNFTFPLSCPSGTPVILLPGFAGSSIGYSSDAYYPELTKTRPTPANELHIHAPVTTGFGNYYGFTGIGIRQHLENAGFTVYDCPWDWRLNIDQASNLYLWPCIYKALSETKAEMVAIVAHSTGGLLVRSFIQNTNELWRKVDKVAMVGVPNRGLADPYLIWEGGDPRTLDAAKEKFNPPLVDGPIPIAADFYANTIEELYETYHSWWSNVPFDDYREVRKFLREEAQVDSAVDLMGIDDFLLSALMPSGRPVNDSESKNVRLKELNAMRNRKERMSPDGAGDTVRVGLFIGKSKQTIGDIEVGVAGDRLYEDGMPILGMFDTRSQLNGVPPDTSDILPTNGDGTVPYASAKWPADDGWAKIIKEDANVEHPFLVGEYAADITNFLLGVTTPVTDTAAKTVRLSGPDTPGTISELDFSINGPMRILVVDAAGRRSGVDPATLTVIDEIPAVTMNFNYDGGGIVINDAPDGTYRVILFGDSASIFRIKVGYADGSTAEHWEETGYYHGREYSLQVQVNRGAGDEFVISVPVEKVLTLSAEPYVSGNSLLTRLRWDGGLVPIPSLYRIYARTGEDGAVVPVGEIAGTDTQSDTAIAWASDVSTAVTEFSVTAVNGSGDESYLSNRVRNDDRDNDVLSDAQETTLGTDMNNPDSDVDGLADGQEYQRGTNPLLADTDGDGIDDGAEVKAGTDPLVANRPPVLASIGEKNVTVEHLLSFVVTGYDPDGEKLSFSASNLPAGANFDPVTATFTWTPTLAQAGIYAGVEFKVSDGMLSDSEVITIRVRSYSIVGKIRTYLGAPLARVNISLTPEGGSARVTRTGSMGRYTFTGLPPNTLYTIRPVRAGWYFTPKKRVVLLSNASLMKQNFTATPR